MPAKRTAIPFPRTLWDLLRPRAKPAPAAPASRARPAPAGARTGPSRGKAPARQPAPNSMAARYSELERRMLKQYGVRVRKWRTSMSGVAWQVTYQDGSVSRLLESPRPRGPMSCAIFLHEIGHHAIGFKTYKPRCLEEYHAWKFAIDTMEAEGLNVTDRVRQRMRDSLRYAVAKAARRGLKKIPGELLPYLDD
jgi:hypothetical protein